MKSLLLSLIVVLGLSSCGNGHDSKSNSNGIIVSESFQNLPQCTNSVEGNTSFVKDNASFYNCKNGTWSFIGQSTTGEMGNVL